MSFIEKRKEIRPESGEVPFGLEEVFYSRTDSHGVILAGNFVFRRVSHIDWPELLGAPCKVLRHPDMPRAVFWLMWNRIKQDSPIGVYLNNRAEDGLNYWVFAIIAPCKDGYLSAQIKPTGALREVVEREYAELRAAEQDEGLTPEASAARLTDRLATLGFASYERFAAQALASELNARDAGLGAQPDKLLARFATMQEAAGKLRDETEALIADFHAMRTIPHNMQVIASRLEPTGGPVSTLSKNYRSVSKEMSDWFEANIIGTGSTFSTIFDSVQMSTFLEAMNRILRECDTQLKAERRTLGDIDLDVERRILGQQMREFQARSDKGQVRVRSEAARILTACETMNRHVLGLSTTRLLCKMESGRLTDGGNGLNEIIVQLGTFQERIGSRLGRIADASRDILDLAR